MRNAFAMMEMNMAELISFESARRRPRHKARSERAIMRELALPRPQPASAQSKSVARHHDICRSRSEERPVLGVFLALVAVAGLILFASHLCGSRAFSDRSIVVSSGISPF
jgi:hypothetical protein